MIARQLVQWEGVAGVPAMKTIKAGSRCDLYDLAPGVRGYAIKHRQVVYIPIIEAVNPGNGDVGRFLDTLPGEYRRAKIPNVLSAVLQGMLRRRGFRLTFEHPNGERVDVWCKP